MATRRPPSALLSRYLEQYRRQPGSRVFAPLAEAYRKLGMYDEALKVLKEGIKRHPSYVLGYLVLAQCYHDQQQNDAAYQTLLPLTPHNRDNPGLMKLFAEVCLALGHLEEALQTFEYLLFLNPRDKYYATQVKMLEDDLHKTSSPKPQSIVVKAPDSLSFANREDDWELVDFTHDPPAVAEEEWSMKSLESSPLKNKSREEDWQVMARGIDDDFFSDEEISPEDSDAPFDADSKPLASHTLVDLYLAQNHTALAIDLLENIVSLNPQDQRSQLRLAELKRSVKEDEAPKAEGPEELLRMVQTQVQGPHALKMEKALQLFLSELKERAREKRHRHV